jgi:hypothetical protein
LKKLLSYLTLVIAIALIVWGVLLLLPNEESRIRKRLVSLAQTASFGANASPIARLAAASQLPEYFTTDVEFDLTGANSYISNINGREALQQAAAGAATQLRQMQVEFVDVQVIVEPDQQNAIALLTVLAHINGERNSAVQMLKMNLRRPEKTWQVYKVETLKPLGR